MNQLSDFLRNRRKALGLTQQNIANELNVSNKAVSKWETGVSFPDVSQLLPLANILGCTVDDLMRGEIISGESAGSDASSVRSVESVNVTASRPWRKYLITALCCAVLGILAFFLFLLTFGNGYQATDIWALSILLFFIGAAILFLFVGLIVYCVYREGE